MEGIMPDNKKQGHSNKAMTFLSASSLHWQDFLWPGYWCYRRGAALYHQ
jgi:hypothetical protein